MSIHASLARARPLALVISFLPASPSTPPIKKPLTLNEIKENPWIFIFDKLSVSSNLIQNGFVRSMFGFRPDLNSNRYFTLNSPKYPSRLSGKRGYATGPQKVPRSNQNPSVQADEDDSAWDHIFANIDEDIAVSRNNAPQRVITKRPTRIPSPAHGTEPAIQKRYSRRPPMTASEKNAFDSMFDMIFRATNQKKENFTTAAVPLPLKSLEQRSVGWSWLRHNLSGDIDVTGSNTNDRDLRFKFPSSSSSDVLPLPRLPPDTYGKLRNLPKRTTELDQLLDQKKEEVALCDSDSQVLGWAVRELFGESNLEKASLTSTQTKNIPLPPALYAPLLTYLMQFFISPPYYNHHTALALFTYAKTLSSASYVFGCNTSAYNVYLQARWATEQDINEILAILQEMDANGINYNSDTRNFLEKVRRDIEEKWRNSEDFLVDDSLNFDGADSNPLLILERAEQLLEHKRRISLLKRNDKSRLDQSFFRESRDLQLGEEDSLTLI